MWTPPEDYVTISARPDGTRSVSSPLDPAAMKRLGELHFETWFSGAEAAHFMCPPPEAYTGIRARGAGAAQEPVFLPNIAFLEFFHTTLAEMAYATPGVVMADGKPRNGSWMLLDGRPASADEPEHADVFGLVGLVDGIVTPGSYLRNVRYRRWIPNDPIPAAFHPALLSRLKSLYPTWLVAEPALAPAPTPQPDPPPTPPGSRGNPRSRR